MTVRLPTSLRFTHPDLDHGLPGLVCTLAFWTNDETTAGLAVHYVRRAIERFEPRVEVLAITATRQPDTPYRLDIRCEFQPRFGGDPQALTVGLDLDGRQED